MHDSFNLYSPTVTEHMAVRPLECGRTWKGRVRNVTLWGNRCHGPGSDTTMCQNRVEVGPLVTREKCEGSESLVNYSLEFACNNAVQEIAYITLPSLKHCSRTPIALLTNTTTTANYNVLHKFDLADCIKMNCSYYVVIRNVPNLPLT